MSSESPPSIGLPTAASETSAPRVSALPDERARLQALQSYEIMDTGPELRFDDLTLLASQICHTPMALIALIDEHRQWFKSRIGLDRTQLPRDLAFCAPAMVETDKVFTVVDATLDERFAAHPLVTGDPYIRFYAGAPLVSAEGHALGALCVIDREPRHLTADQQTALLALSRQVMALLEERRTSAALRGAMHAQTHSEALFREAYETSPIGIALVSPEGGWLRVNEALCDLLGYPAEELERSTTQTITHPDDLESDVVLLRKLLARELRTYQLEKRYLHRMGHVVWVKLSVSLVWDDQRPLYFIWQIQDVGERKNIERGKSEFLTMVSHELRTPVAALRGALGILAAGAAGVLPPKAQTLTALAERNADRLHRLVNDILAIDSIESGAFAYRLSDVDLNQLVSQAALELRPYAEQNQVAIEVRSDLPRAFAHADADRLMQVLANLISNAIEQSPAGGAVVVQVTRTDQTIRVDITDRGVGIPEELRPHIFEKFARIHWTATQREADLALGLNISRAIIQRHGGVLAFHTAPGVGSTFYFELPVL